MNEQARLLYIELEKIHLAPITRTAKLMRLYEFLSQIFNQVTQKENIHFTTLFARMAFVGRKYQVPADTQWQVYMMRRRLWEIIFRRSADTELDYERSLLTVALTLEGIFKEAPAPTLANFLPPHSILPLREDKLVEHRSKVRFFCTEVQEDKHWLLGFDEERPGLQVKARYGQPGLNEHFDGTVANLKKHLKGQATLNLLEVGIDEHGIYLPAAIVLEPDYLVDVSAISECFQGSYVQPMLNLLKKMIPSEPTVPMLQGNIANFFLDELMNDEEAQFSDTFVKVFQKMPLDIALLSDQQVKDLRQSSQKHFINILKMVKGEFAKQGILKENCYLEPSFFSERYGLQGRLDIWFRDLANDKSAIVELKSGKPFKPNRHGIGHSHYTQTLLYDLLVTSVYPASSAPGTYILYSGLEVDNLKFAPPLEAHQMEALEVRNQIVINEYRLAQLDVDVDKLEWPSLLEYLRPSIIPDKSGFIAADLLEFEKVYRNASSVERKYFNAFAAFVAREHLLARTGPEGQNAHNGQASLWLTSQEEKTENFDILSHLELLENHAAEDDALLVFGRTAATPLLANFRIGDIAVLYPQEDHADETAAVLRNQIFKVSIVQLTPEHVVVKLRFKQFNDQLFRMYGHWNIEHDAMDMNFTQMSGGLFEFLRAEKEFKELFLTQKPPANPADNADGALGYFLLVGPPGTGKTKQQLARRVREKLEGTQENLLLLAYTNRAVDEICDAIHEFAANDYLRIGNRSTCEERFADNLLSVKMESVKSRKELLDLLKGKRIFVSTMASMSVNRQLFNIKEFDSAIIDEASQIPEPMLPAILSKVRHFTLIGDHKQLPAVVQQSPAKSTIEDEELRAIGLTDRRDSLFERLFRRCVEENWHWAYGELEHQGRMHQDIVDFPSKEFYGGKLRLLQAAESDEQHWQRKPLGLVASEDADALGKALASKRMLFVNTPKAGLASTFKTNPFEAEKCVEIVQQLESIYEHNGRPLNLAEVGIITPYRAQIALIRKKLDELGERYQKITVDTVERYQGGARDVIIISICANSPIQLKNLVSPNQDGTVDRKLNVALTRARQHCILVGNREVLEHDKIYQKLIAKVTE